jgi:hypothetical protein
MSEFFNKFVKVIKYDECAIDETELIGVYFNDGEFDFIEFKKIDLPKMDNPDVISSQKHFF